MSFRILHCRDINPKLWNKSILKHHSDVYNEFYYLQSVTLSNWFGIIWGDYEKVLPFYRKRKWGIIPYICMPPFCQKFDVKPLNKKELEDVITYLKNKNFLVDFRVNDSKNIDEFSLKQNFILNKKSQTITAIQSNYAGLLKKNIIKAKKTLTLHQCESLSNILPFLQANNQFIKLINTKSRKEFFELIQNIPNEISVAKLENEIVAVLIKIVFEKKAYIVFPFSSELGKKYQAMSLLIDEVVGNENIEIVDFEGSNIKSIANFYSQFGGSIEPYYAFSWHKVSFSSILPLHF